MTPPGVRSGGQRGVPPLTNMPPTYIQGTLKGTTYSVGAETQFFLYKHQTALRSKA
ncbi:hypothetical protein J6590_061102 [Homalodisca vitripennis]|nr:hypothetical protein J6590_061102 [Homalodisca vitripennis]